MLGGVCCARTRDLGSRDHCEAYQGMVWNGMELRNRRTASSALEACCYVRFPGGFPGPDPWTVDVDGGRGRARGATRVCMRMRMRAIEALCRYAAGTGDSSARGSTLSRARAGERAGMPPPMWRRQWSMVDGLWLFVRFACVTSVADEFYPLPSSARGNGRRETGDALGQGHRPGTVSSSL